MSGRQLAMQGPMHRCLPQSVGKVFRIEPWHFEMLEQEKLSSEPQEKAPLTFPFNTHRKIHIKTQ